jgi:hypothetical protein
MNRAYDDHYPNTTDEFSAHHSLMALSAVLPSSVG